MPSATISTYDMNMRVQRLLKERRFCHEKQVLARLLHQCSLCSPHSAAFRSSDVELELLRKPWIYTLLQLLYKSYCYWRQMSQCDVVLVTTNQNTGFTLLPTSHVPIIPTLHSIARSILYLNERACEPHALMTPKKLTPLLSNSYAIGPMSIINFVWHFSQQCTTISYSIDDALNIGLSSGKVRVSIDF